MCPLSEVCRPRSNCINLLLEPQPHLLNWVKVVDCAGRRKVVIEVASRASRLPCSMTKRTIFDDFNIAPRGLLESFDSSDHQLFWAKLTYFPAFNPPPSTFLLGMVTLVCKVIRTSGRLYPHPIARQSMVFVRPHLNVGLLSRGSHSSSSRLIVWCLFTWRRSSIEHSSAKRKFLQSVPAISRVTLEAYVRHGVEGGGRASSV